MLDLTPHYQLNRNARVDVGLFNVFDRTISAISQVLDAFAQPGRNFAVSFNYRF